jgi:hypothetical protein
MMQTITILTVTILLLSACGKKDDGSTSQSAPVVTQDTPALSDYSTETTSPKCSTILRCTQQCFSFYPYQDPGDIRKEYNARGLLFSGMLDGALKRNQEIISQYNACTALPANQVISYP